MSEHVVLIGACGWQHPTWVKEFYPEGLPEDWQLGYYGNEYRVVLIPADYWQNPQLDVRQWLEETDQSPRFLSEWPQDPEAQKHARTGMALLAERAIGFVIELHALPSEADMTIYKELIASQRLVFDFNKLSAAQYASLINMLDAALGKGRYGICWRGDAQTAADLQTGPIAFTRINQVKDAKALRRIIEACLAAYTGNRLVILIIDGDPPDIQLMQNAGIILDLL